MSDEPLPTRLRAAADWSDAPWWWEGCERMTGHDFRGLYVEAADQLDRLALADAERTPLIVFEHTSSGLVARCLLCGVKADPVAQPSWHGRHIRTQHPEYVTWVAETIPEGDPG